VRRPRISIFGLVGAIAGLSVILALNRGRPTAKSAAVSELSQNLDLRALRAGRLTEARRQLDLAIDALLESGVLGNALPLLYERKARAALALSQSTGPNSGRYCRMALDDLAMVRRASRKVDTYVGFLIEHTTARVGQRLGEIAASEGYAFTGWNPLFSGISARSDSRKMPN
jgi:hypothetical protein